VSSSQTGLAGSAAAWHELQLSRCNTAFQKKSCSHSMPTLNGKGYSPGRAHRLIWAVVGPANQSRRPRPTPQAHPVTLALVVDMLMTLAAVRLSHQTGTCSHACHTRLAPAVTSRDLVVANVSQSNKSMSSSSTRTRHQAAGNPGPAAGAAAA
jgi:hypothetical protein